MAKLIEIDEFTEEVYQLEVTDFVEGGENGADNKPHKALTNRTRWLKSKIDAFLAGTGLTKAMVGLSNVDNTSDLAKPISTATQTALNWKEPTILILPVEKGGTGRTTDMELNFSSTELPSQTQRYRYLFNTNSGADMDNIPYPSNYYWIETEFYSNRNSSKHQVSTQYISQGVSKKFQRSFYDNIWTSWVEILTANSITQVLTSTGGYRVEPEDSSGKKLITQWGKVTTNSPNYQVTFPTAFTVTPTVKINFEEPTSTSSFSPVYFATNSRTTTGFRITENGSATLGGAILWEAKGY